MRDLYRTIKNRAEGQFKDRGSRFIAFAYPLQDEDEIRQQMAVLKKEYHDARHHCFAWRLGAEMERYRVNDDGEPSGSAGKPIFGQLQSRELTDILVVVIRYFGGTLLGVGGLINAYRTAAAAALDHAVIVEKRVEERLDIKFGYTAMNAVMKVIKGFDLGFENQQFDLECSLTVRVWIRHTPGVVEKLSQIEGCRVIVES
ncbi:MAG: YigZ family protein [Bacteroidota bacterium]